MKDYSLLMNQVYLWVLEHQTQKINFSKLAIELGVTRQTVAKEFKKFQDLKELNCFHIKDFHSELKGNKKERALTILFDLLGDEHWHYTNNELAAMLGISHNAIHRPKIKKEKIVLGGVYCIKYNNEIIYIGTTYNFEERKNQHWTNIKQKSGVSLFYKHCLEYNIVPENLVFIELIKTNNKKLRLDLERQLIKALNPICNEIID